MLGAFLVAAMFLIRLAIPVAVAILVGEVLTRSQAKANFS